jgi:plastocyanin
MMRLHSTVVATCLTAVTALSACGGSAPATLFPSLGADVVVFQAKGSRFVTDIVHVPRDKAWTLALDNQDGLPHNVVILDRDNTSVFASAVFTGSALKTEPAPALPAGDYHFTCAVHPDMKGTLTVP